MFLNMTQVLPSIFSSSNANSDITFYICTVVSQKNCLDPFIQNNNTNLKQISQTLCIFSGNSLGNDNQLW